MRLHAAGSLRPALTELGQAFTKAHGARVEAQFGSSGLLRERLERGEAGDVYASADMGSPLALARAGKAGPVVLFARNRLCAIVRPGLQVTPGTVLAAMLAPGTKLGTSTPRNDPAGDYAWQVFAKAEAVQPGARQALEAKALRLTGAPDSPRPPDGRSVYAWHVLDGRADLFPGLLHRGTEGSGGGARHQRRGAAAGAGGRRGLRPDRAADRERSGRPALCALRPVGRGAGHPCPVWVRRSAIAQVGLVRATLDCACRPSWMHLRRH